MRVLAEESEEAQRNPISILYTHYLIPSQNPKPILTPNSHPKTTSFRFSMV
jgi:hypothetical protein